MILSIIQKLDFQLSKVVITSIKLEQARVAFLQLCGQLQLYGLKGHDARDDRGLPVQLASNHAGVVMLQHERQLDRWPWSKIRKLSFKRRRFLIKPRLPNTATPTVFIFATRDLAKNFWKVIYCF